MGPFCVTRPNTTQHNPTQLSLANIITLLLLLISFRYLSDRPKIKFNCLVQPKCFKRTNSALNALKYSFQVLLVLLL